MSIPAARWWEKAMDLSGGVMNTAAIESDI